jgi:SpoVK/Ycf46/Vps4 family AAA+-type ATPase
LYCILIINSKLSESGHPSGSQKSKVKSQNFTFVRIRITRIKGFTGLQISQTPRQLLLWDIVTGWDDNGTDKGSVMGALSRITKTPENTTTIFVLRDIHFILKNPETEKNAPVIRAIKNLTRQLKRTRQTLILTSHTLTIPPELQEEITVIDFPLPNIEEIDYLIQQLIVPEKLNLNGLGKEQLIKACQGLSRARIRRVLAAALAAKGQVNETDIDRVLEEKKQAVRQTGILEFYTAHESLKNVGGLENLKQWVRMRQDAFTEEARRYGIPNAKGVLLVGIQGTGKSLSAKTIAHEWRLPLLRLDVATANNVQILPAELLRKGRFDEIFFLNLPTEKERHDIFKVHLQKIRPSRLREFDLQKLASHSENFSGAEIQQVIIDGMHRAFGSLIDGNRRDFNTEDILAAVSETVPLAAIAKEQITSLKRWAAEAGARTASIDTLLIEELKVYSQQQGLGPLEVD